jgi:hypothetical protein
MAVLGLWNGFIYSGAVSTAGMISMTLRPSTLEGQDLHFQASGRSNTSDFTVSGECSWGEAPNAINFTFKRSFPARLPTQYWYGQLNTDTDTMTGTCGHDADRATQRAIFILKRTAPEYLCFRPAPATFEANKARALWTYALSAIQYHVRRQSYSWPFFSERRDNRKRFIELYIRNTEYGCPLDRTEAAELARIRQTFTTADNRFYHSLAQYQIRIILGHGRVFICTHFASTDCHSPTG